MFTEADKKQIESRGMTVEQVERQPTQPPRKRPSRHGRTTSVRATRW